MQNRAEFRRFDGRFEPPSAKATLLTRMRSRRIALGNIKKVADMNDGEIEQELLPMPITELAKGFT